MKIQITANCRNAAINMLNTKIEGGVYPAGLWIVYPDPVKNRVYICERFGDKIA